MKKQINPSTKAHVLRRGLVMQLVGALFLALLAAANNLPKESTSSPALLQPSAATHETRAGLQEVIEFPSANGVTPRIETISSAPPTRGSLHGDLGQRKRRKRLFPGCVHEQLVQHLRRRLSRLGRWQCQWPGRNRIKSRDDLLLSGAFLHCRQFGRVPRMSPPLRRSLALG